MPHGIEQERHPGQWRNRFEDLNEGIEGPIQGARQADHHAKHNRHHGRGEKAHGEPHHGVADQMANAMIVGAALVKWRGELFNGRHEHGPWTRQATSLLRVVDVLPVVACV